MNACAVIPARMASTRLPRKILADLDGKPLLWHVWSRVCLARHFSSVWIVTDSQEIQGHALEWGAKVLMSSESCQSGTERIASVLDKLPGDLIVNIQGDEPFISPDMLDELVEEWQNTTSDLITAVFPIQTEDELQNPNVVKVVRTGTGQALYFSRSPIPHVRGASIKNWLEHGPFWGHVGVYGYKRSVLADYPSFSESLLEKLEKLEQLRFLEAGYKFHTIETSYRTLSVDTLEDLELARKILQDEQY